MAKTSNQTTWIKEQKGDRTWYLFDASKMSLGRLASAVAMVLMGKHKATFVPNIDVGDTVIVINADQLEVTGRKAEYKQYLRYSGYQSGLKRIPFAKYQEEMPERIINSAVKGMLPKNKLQSERMKRLYVYRGSEHPHTAQQPVAYNMTKAK